MYEKATYVYSFYTGQNLYLIAGFFH